MRAYWILPNRDQRDDILASDGKTLLPLRQILDPKDRPEGFSHGVPTELLEKQRPKAFWEILFAQRFPGWNGDKQLFSVTTTAGVDSSGRVVHLGLLFVLEPHERPQFDLSYAGLPEKDRAYAEGLIRRMTSAGSSDSWAQSVRDLIELPSDDRPATNVALDRSVVPFHSLYVLGPGGLTKKPAHWRSRRTGIIFLVVLLGVGVWICVHLMNCSVALGYGERFPRPVASIGVLTWRFD